MCRCLFYLGPWSSSTEVNYNLFAGFHQPWIEHWSRSLLCAHFWGGGVTPWFYIWELNASYVSTGVSPYALPCVLQPVTKAGWKWALYWACLYWCSSHAFREGLSWLFGVGDLKENQTGVVKNIPFPSFPLSRVVSLHLFLLLFH